MKFRIKGVFKDFDISSLNNQGEVLGKSIIYRPEQRKFLAIKYSTSKPLAMVNKVQDLWRDYFGVNSLNYFFLDDSMRKIYKSEITQRKIFLLFALTAILIAGFGLFAMAFDTIIQRTKEIGIRKVNGAKTGNILTLLFSDYVGIFLLSILPGLIIAYYASYKWLEEYYYRISISWYYFLVPIILISIVILVSVIYHSLKAAVSNPINSLKYE
ncbi:MAG: FtsX-like permease family protein [Mariniphaga sp.]|nr:FtsX-like permease family protein [Mariniphaga sp.]